MRAHVLVRNSSPSNSFELQEVPVPVPGPGQVRIRVTTFGINFADIMARQGLYRGCPPLPTIIGYDVEGVIDETGPGVKSFEKGNRVFALTRFGGYAEYVVTQADAVGHLPEDADSGIGCALATQAVTAYHGTEIVQSLFPGEKVLIHAAAGGLGTALIQIALWKGCFVIAVVGGEEKVNYVRSLGVPHVIDHHTTSYPDYIQKTLGGQVDVVFDNVGGTSLKTAKSILAPGGRIVSLGAAALSGKKGYINLLRLVFGFGWFSPISFLGKSQSLIGINMLKIADHRPDMIAAGFKGVEDLYRQGILKPHVGQVFRYDALDQAHSFVEGRHAIGKVAVSW